MRKLCTLVIFNILICMLCGCTEAEKTFAEPAIEISKDGKMNQTIVESFDKDYYSIDELRNDFESAISECELSDGENISLIDLHEENGNVFASLNFSSCETASDFSEDVYFYGNISEAYDAGYLLEVNLKNVLDNTIVGKTELLSKQNNHIFITSDTGLIYTAYKILYISPNIELIDDKKVRVSSDGDGLAYIVMK